MKKAILIIALILPLITGCAFTDFFIKKDPPPDAVIPEKRVDLDPKVLESCKKLIPLVVSQSASDSYLAILDNLAENAKIHSECYDKQEGSIKLLKGFANKQEKK